MKIDIITIFPGMFDLFLNTSIIFRAIESKKISLNIIDLRTYAANKHRKVDDTPYGGGVGMVMAFPPFYEAINAIKTSDSYVIYLSPQGRVLTQAKANTLAQKNHLILLCGHYEGIDERVLSLVDEEISIGDFVLTGGEIPAMVLTDVVSRLVPGVIHESSVLEDSLQNGLLKYPQYTKPENYLGYEVPQVLISGHHENISKWRLEKSIEATWLKRPDLLEQVSLDVKQQEILKKVKERLHNK